MSRGARSRAVPVAGPPRLAADMMVAALILAAFGFAMRGALTPDGVAYLENAELFAQGRFADAIQGYWSPGYSLILAPAAWLASGDRAMLLLLAHAVQSALGVAALWLAILTIRHRVPAHAQRVVFWASAWVIMRWLTPELLTPDLLLCVLVLCFTLHMPARGPRDEIWLGVIVGAGFLVKTSIWPWLVVALGIVAARHVRNREWKTFPAIATGVGLLVAAAFVVILSVRAGHPTIGSVGPLNLRWYLGDVSRRTPETDQGTHTARRPAMLPSGVVVAFHDMRPTSKTYAPWSDPEGWARGVPASAVPSFSFTQVGKSWRQNAGEFLRWMLPLGLGIGLIMAWSSGLRHGYSISDFLDRPMLWVGVSAALVFLVVHAEHRLLAPSALLILLGAWSDPTSARPRSRFRWLTVAVIACIGAQLLSYMPSAARIANARRAGERPIDDFFSRERELTPARDVVLVGPFGLWMGVLWRHHLRVAAQIGEQGESAISALPDNERLAWLRSQFGDSVLGVASTVVRREGGVANVRLEFSPF